MKTSCYNDYKGNDGIGISLTVPSFWKGEVYKDLAPSPKLLHDIKNGKITQEQYAIQYNNHLNTLDVNKVYNDLKDKVLLCWERPGEFCHRRLVSEWIEKNINGVTVPEWKSPKSKKLI